MLGSRATEGYKMIGGSIPGYCKQGYTIFFYHIQAINNGFSPLESSSALLEQPHGCSHLPSLSSDLLAELALASEGNGFARLWFPVGITALIPTSYCI